MQGKVEWALVGVWHGGLKVVTKPIGWMQAGQRQTRSRVKLDGRIDMQYPKLTFFPFLAPT